MKKARLHLDPFEMAYSRKYGILPDCHFTRLYHERGPSEAARIVNGNMDALWKEMQEEFTDTDAECPF